MVNFFILLKSLVFFFILLIDLIGKDFCIFGLVVVCVGVLVFWVVELIFFKVFFVLKVFFWVVFLSFFSLLIIFKIFFEMFNSGFFISLNFSKLLIL